MFCLGIRLYINGKNQDKILQFKHPNQFVKMEVSLENHLVRMEIDLHVLMAQAL